MGYSLEYPTANINIPTDNTTVNTVNKRVSYTYGWKNLPVLFVLGKPLPFQFFILSHILP